MEPKPSDRALPRRRRPLLWIGAFLTVFLLGAAPQYLQVRQLRNELKAAQWQNRMAELRDLAGMMFLETSQKNYGLAGQHASRFFTQARAMLGETSDPNIQAFLTEALSRQNAITANLAKGDAAVFADVQYLYKKAHETSAK